MFLDPGKKRVQFAILTVLFLGVALTSDAVLAEDDPASGFALRNHNPFLQIFGLPPLQSATLATADALRFGMTLDLANNADFGAAEAENFFIDGESYFLTVSLRRRMHRRLELAVDVPLVAHAGGFMDNAIINWHDAFSMSNTKRRGPDDELRFVYEEDGLTRYVLDSSASGLGDIRLSAAIPLREADHDGYALTLRSSVKLPTGDDRKLLGSGAADLAVGLYVTDVRHLLARPLGLSAFAGGLLLGDGDVLSGFQRRAVPFGGFTVSWRVMERLSIITQLQAQGAYFDSEIDELGGNTTQLGVGFSYRLRQSGRCLKFAVVEDITADATTDFALQFAFDNGCTL